MLKSADLYQSYVVGHQLERTGLFALLRETWPAAHTVLYPGCFLHVTPSFFYQHVVYVDRNELARDFFADVEGVRRLISARRQYRQDAHVRFLEQDYTTPLPLPEASFDLLLALYAGGISRACHKYLKPGGLLLTNDHHGDAAEAASEKTLELVAVVTERRGHFEFRTEDLSGFLVPKEPGRPHSRGGSGYVRSADAYLFRRKRTDSR
ncbi:class I SAM-dependent methyltransferase [Pyxidicoccus fallax]|uniref:Class I SAM-dependent methyltransferase n=1 Tax=Pyxidicoccus fallax TaxID=394095 RepID=A0A848LDI2_9BACT|nr:class I SAM-dependent methyltransferase [Pyxidicoccus fallax]NMO16282.1 class I SAM-dependent methyltransferase [Pyxidicoccus fallax]NPC81873.1 class I SAM-dependent methyltransferase [Pyxidicoccus fallax]